MRYPFEPHSYLKSVQIMAKVNGLFFTETGVKANFMLIECLGCKIYIYVSINSILCVKIIETNEISLYTEPKISLTDLSKTRNFQIFQRCSVNTMPF